MSLINHVDKWKPVYLRGALYMAIAMITAALSELDDVTAEKLATLTWLDWFKTSLTVISAGLITLRTFIDQSIGNHETKLKTNGGGSGSV